MKAWDYLRTKLGFSLEGIWLRPDTLDRQSSIANGHLKPFKRDCLRSGSED